MITYQLLRQQNYLLKFITSAKLLHFCISEFSNKRFKEQPPLNTYILGLNF